MNTARTEFTSSASRSPAPTTTSPAVSDEGFPPGLTLLLVLLGALAAIIGVAFYLAGQMPV